jgi:hypothetical protein
MSTRAQPTATQRRHPEVIDSLVADDSAFAEQWSAMKARHASDLQTLEDMLDISVATRPVRTELDKRVRRVLKRRITDLHLGRR